MTRHALWVMLAFGGSGCLSTTSAEVQVRDASRVEIERPNGESLLAAGASSAVVDRGEYWRLLSKEAYEIDARRESNGAIALRCDGCALASHPLLGTTGISQLTLLDETGLTASAPGEAVNVDGSKVSVALDSACMVAGKRACKVPLRARLVVPIAEVVSVRRHREPARAWGYLLVGASVLATGAMTYWLLSPGANDSVRARAPWAIGGASPFLVTGGVGLWHIFAPPEEQLWRPMP